MKNNKRPTVTIAIPAYNEAQNLGSLLDALKKQERQKFILKRVEIVCDGCTDDTARIAKTAAKSWNVLAIVDDSKRAGKVARLNQIFARNSSDILIVLDADIALAGSQVLDNMVRALKNDPKALLVVAHEIPLKRKTFVGRIIYAAYMVWDHTRLAVPHQDHIQNLYGAATAYRASFIKKIRIPSSITDECGYLYLSARARHGFRYVMNAAIYYWPVTTLHDFFKLGDRSFAKNQAALAKIFGKQVYGMYAIAPKYKIRALFWSIVRDPFYTMLGLAINLWSRVFPTRDQLYDRGMWEISTSTKQRITQEDVA
jgi:cellulose synthase/poly-beta-1,6-N-acetylglucosamine synthase-like glycosyltransferase